MVTINCVKWINSLMNTSMKLFVCLRIIAEIIKTSSYGRREKVIIRPKDLHTLTQEALDRVTVDWKRCVDYSEKSL